ncbi:MAG: iron ABC transporter permease [Hyphomicrobiales bacterium]|nr:iron ABC transporter permease [Hyphomicrobiales bacterium]
MSVNIQKSFQYPFKNRRINHSPVFARGQKRFVIFTFAVSLIIILPILSLIVLALGGDGESFAHIVKNVLPRAGPTTIILLVETGALAALAGFIGAWLVSFYEFPGRRVFSWALMLPMAVPTYLAAYGFVEFFSFTGPVQTLIRQLGGYTSMREYWFFDIRSPTGAAIVLSLVLYPYVYMAVRTVFHFQGARMVESARSTGAGRARVLFRILMPMARPAIVLGVTLALMEAINDIGAMEYLGVETLTFSVFSIWLNQDDMAGAAQLALFLLIVVFVLIRLERWARQNRQFYDSSTNSLSSRYRREQLDGWQGLLATTFTALPVLLGFGIPFYIMAGYAWDYLDQGFDPDLLNALFTSFAFASIAGLVTVLLALVMAYSVRVSRSPGVALLVRLASIGYAIPGTIVALGIFLPLAMFDNFFDGLMRQGFGISTGLLITGSGATMILAYVVRFMAMGEGSLENGMQKISPRIDMASRSLGKTSSQTLRLVLLPILKPVMATAFLLVFIDSLKELSATITLRPFGINTLSTYIYDYASRSRVEEIGLASLIVMAAGIIPVILIMRTMLDRRG